jgi:hypothetical protein
VLSNASFSSDMVDVSRISSPMASVSWQECQYYVRDVALNKQQERRTHILQHLDFRTDTLDLSVILRFEMVEDCVGILTPSPMSIKSALRGVFAGKTHFALGVAFRKPPVEPPFMYPSAFEAE